jgi:WhiB family redox-sensing transcriptional regulator
MVTGLVPKEDNQNRKDAMKIELNITNYPDFFSEGDPPCSQADPNAFHPEELETGASRVVSRYYDEYGAKTICKSCPYMMQCLKYAIDNNEMGIWGGTNEMERKSIKRAIRSGATASQIEVRIKR